MVAADEDQRDLAIHRLEHALQVLRLLLPPGCSWHGVDEVPTQNKEFGFGVQLVDGLHGLLSEADLLSPLITTIVTVPGGPGLHQSKLWICTLDEVEWALPFPFLF